MASKAPNTAIAMRNVKHILVAAVLFGAPFLACSSATSPTTSDAGAGGGGGGAKFRLCLEGCDQAQSDTHAACLHAKCDGQYAKCYGAGYKTGTFAGAPCSDLQACDQKCACGDTKCREACAVTGECTKCVFGELLDCLRDVNCTAPACSNADAGSDSGGGGVDSGGGGGGGKPNCTALAACCAKLPDPTKSKCTDLVDRDDDIYCGNVKDNYCSLDPSACTKLDACCATLSGSDKTSCELQVTTYGTDVELCGVALKSYPTCR